MEPLRFVHSARLLLDHPVCGVGPLPEALQDLAEDATLLAWDRVVQTCLSEQVDFLLLAGDTIDPALGSLRGPAELLRGCQRLSAAGIPVIIAPGTRDSWEEWPGGLRWPASVARLGDEGVDEVPLTRDGRPLATVRTARRGEQASGDAAPWLLRLPSDTAETSQSFEVIVDARRSSPVMERDARASSGGDYRALGGFSAPRTVAIGRDLAHDPGPPQGLQPEEGGARGCTLVVVDAARSTQRQFVPTAPLRFEQLSLTVAEDESRDDVLLNMVAALEGVSRYPTDRAWLVSWNVGGAGPWLDAFRDAVRRAPLLAALDAEHGLEGLLVHSAAVRVTAAPPRPALDAFDQELTRDFDSRLRERIERPQRSLARCLSESVLAGGPWQARVEALAGRLDAGEVAQAALQTGRAWFAAAEETDT